MLLKAILSSGRHNGNQFDKQTSEVTITQHSIVDKTGREKERRRNASPEAQGRDNFRRLAQSVVHSDVHRIGWQRTPVVRVCNYILQTDRPESPEKELEIALEYVKVSPAWNILQMRRPPFSRPVIHRRYEQPAGEPLKPRCRQPMRQGANGAAGSCLQ
jgi:hypothetical protein